jgi:hypothetical protein
VRGQPVDRPTRARSGPRDADEAHHRAGTFRLVDQRAELESRIEFVLLQVHNVAHPPHTGGMNSTSWPAQTR